MRSLRRRLDSFAFWPGKMGMVDIDKMEEFADVFLHRACKQKLGDIYCRQGLRSAQWAADGT